MIQNSAVGEQTDSKSEFYHFELEIPFCNHPQRALESLVSLGRRLWICGQS